ncbi:extensin family protein [Rhodobacteraceae bacterium CCMM004]|nr:extensin family protein [Rhodobacteraceae bacterium CCMM004]
MRVPVSALALALALTGAIASAQSDTAPAESPRPELRPDPETREEEFLPDEIPAAEGEAEAPAPDTAVPGVWETLAESDADYAACLADLDALGTVYTSAPQVTEDDPDCGIARPIRVTEILPGVEMQPDAVLRCATARALARWVQDDVQPAARAIGTLADVTALDHGSTYICRRRNNAATGKLSEHSFGNAVDVMAFDFADGTTLRVEPRADNGTVEEAFQRAVRGGACVHFTTVLGPGTDATHDNHLHMDIKERNGGYRICQ